MRFRNVCAVPRTATSPGPILVTVALLALGACADGAPDERPSGEAGAVLPFDPPPTGGSIGRTMQESVHKWREQPRHLPEDAPNILIVMLDDAGFGQPSTFGGEIETPTLSRLANEGISYNAFHTTAMCSPTRAALMTGRNHNRVGFGQIAELANDWDGYTGVIPKSSATIAEVLGYYGYATAAFGKDHNTPVDQIANGPYDRTPTGRGFDYFYGFIAGETSQWEPTLWENTTPISPPHVENYEDYHLTEAMADKAITWMRRHLAMNPDRPFLMWWTPGAVHGPHHVAERVGGQVQGQVQRRLGCLPAAGLRAAERDGLDPGRYEVGSASGRDAGMGGSSREERAFQERLMEVYAGFLEHTDVQVGKLIDELEARGIRDNTLVIYILSDNGASAEGMNGSVAELNAQNGIPTTVDEHIAVAEQLGGLDAIGGPKMDNMYHSAWAWAGDSPVPLHQADRRRLGRHAHSDGDLVAEAHQARQDTAAAVPPRQRRGPHHSTRSSSIQPPKVVDGHKQDPIDGTSFVYTFDSPDAPGAQDDSVLRHHGQPRHLPRRLDGQHLRAPSAVGGRNAGHQQLGSHAGPWELFDTRQDFSLMHDLAAEYPESSKS